MDKRKENEMRESIDPIQSNPDEREDEQMKKRNNTNKPCYPNQTHQPPKSFF